MKVFINKWYWPAAALLICGGMAQGQRNLHDLLYFVRKKDDFRYPMIGASGPVTKFMPGNKSDWTIDYLQSHPQELGLGLYLMEESYYESGESGVEKYISDLFAKGTKLHRLELKFDAQVLKTLLPAPVQLVVRQRSGSAYYDLSKLPVTLSLSQVILLNSCGYPKRHSYAQAINWLMKQYPGNSYILSNCGGFIEFVLDNPQFIRQGGGLSPTDKQSGYFTVGAEKAFYAKAVKADPDNLGAWMSLGSIYNDPKNPNYGEALVCYKKALTVLEKLGANPQGESFHWLKATMIPYLEKKVHPS